MDNNQLKQQILTYAKKLISDSIDYQKLRTNNSFHHIDKKYFDGKANRSNDIAIQFCREFGFDYDILKEEVERDIILPAYPPEYVLIRSGVELLEATVRYLNDVLSINYKKLKLLNEGVCSVLGVEEKEVRYSAVEINNEIIDGAVELIHTLKQKLMTYNNTF